MNEKIKKAKEIIENEKAKAQTKARQERIAKMEKYLANAKNDSGFYGRIVELASCTDGSRKDRVSAQGDTDTFIKIETDNGTKYEKAEVKTNGGRIGSLYEKGAPKFVIYEMNFSNSVASRQVEPKVMKTADFLEMLEDCGAVKMTNGKRNEKAIQVTSKKLYNALQEQTTYDRNRTYYESEI